MKASSYFAIVAAFILVSGSEVGLTQSRSPLATVVSVTGKVEVKQGNAAYRQLKSGETLMQGDLMRSNRRSRGVIRCLANSSTWVVPDDGLPWGVANVCPVPRSQNRLIRSFNQRFSR
ncbi:MAG TPA: hypothetical protein IGS53_21855 [Leptolyngbyaceae cyanobacterium M33_DOE_097]|uniref:Uncharacterized protein n=1 Tax=Oscillatoriales cyanobacterium SpSt-418 TaxID=2282169 RepID=A0A7C3KKN6_9CYAN|nr:hypothetical protein [Leptolyngbyaceae cyanobacterium M33_DOE_097]